jgi:signal transduction histidine kinase
MMHELRTPLTSLNVITSVLADEIELEKSRSASKLAGDLMEAAAVAVETAEAEAAAAPASPPWQSRSLSTQNKQVSLENLIMLQQAVGQLKVV